MRDLRNVEGYGPTGWWFCDVCGFEGIGPVLHCDKCNYDLCAHCFTGSDLDCGEMLAASRA